MMSMCSGKDLANCVVRARMNVTTWWVVIVTMYVGSGMITTYVDSGMDIFIVVIYLVIYVNIGYILVICDCSTFLLCDWLYKIASSVKDSFVSLMVICMIYMYMATILIAVYP